MIDLPVRWRGRARFVVLTDTFGNGERFLALLRAWRDDPQRCAHLVVIAIEAHPSCCDDVAEPLRAVWPPLTPGLHALGFDDGRVQLLLALGDLRSWLPEVVAEIDAFDLRGIDRDRTAWDARIGKALGRLAARGATLAASNPSQKMREGLRSAGFTVDAEQNRGLTLARFEPAFTPRRAPPPPVPRDPHAVIVGAGLAGCAAAWALAEQGWRSTLIERHARIASEASGNAAGLFHGIVNAQDGLHARFHRAASLAAHDAVRIAVRAHGVRGATRGLLRLETTLDVAAMQALIDQLALPPGYVQALDADAASRRAGLALTRPAWFYPAGGWVEPAGLARSWLARAGSRTALRSGIEVHALKRVAGEWQLLGAAGRVIAQAATVVLANAGDALRLLGAPGWPIEPLRGQITSMDARASPFALPHVPLAGAGYLLPEIDGRMVFGATSQPFDGDPSVRDADHRVNIDQLERLTGHRLAVALDRLGGRTAWRWSARDRLPLVGAVPSPTQPDEARLDQPRFVAREPGLFVFSALGARGITWSALCAKVLAADIAGAPLPIEASLRDAIDPARFVSRQVRRASAAARRTPAGD